MIGIALIVGAFLVLVGIIFIGYIIGIYNGLVRLKHNIEKAWSNIDVLLKQRSDELKRLLASVKGHMKFEKSVLTELTKARTAAVGARGVAGKAKAASAMSGALGNLFAVAENYPQLKSSEVFKQFQDRVSGIEESLADRREFYNDSVNTYNIRIHQIPYNMFASMLGYARKELFEVDEADKKDVEVSFD